LASVPVAACSPCDEPSASPPAIIPLAVATIAPDLPQYRRADWRHWIDEDRDCQSTRAEVLIAESLVDVAFTNERGCVVVTGHWIDPYTGNEFTDARLVDIDHMVPLANAHRAGGWQWTAADRQAYANDLTNPQHLVAASASANRSKGDKGHEEWRPPNEGYWCQYATDWVGVKQTWTLTVTQAEWDALVEMLGRC